MTCKVHTPFMQGIKKLMETGNRMTKIAILVGGPDWQTSVLLGILRLPLLPILINSMPCQFGSTFMCISGAMMTRKGEPYESINLVALGGGAMINMFFGMLMTMQITNYLSDIKQFKDIEKEIENDKELKTLRDTDE